MVRDCRLNSLRASAFGFGLCSVIEGLANAECTTLSSDQDPTGIPQGTCSTMIVFGAPVAEPVPCSTIVLEPPSVLPPGADGKCAVIRRDRRACLRYAGVQESDGPNVRRSAMNQQAESKSVRGVRQRLAVVLVAFVLVAGAAWSLLQWAAAEVQLPPASGGESPSVSSADSVRQPAGQAAEQRTVVPIPARPGERVLGVYSVPSGVGSVRGCVVSRSGEGMVGAAVVLRVVRLPADAATVHATAVTDAVGMFGMAGVAPGAYDITAEAPGCLACARIVVRPDAATDVVLVSGAAEHRVRIRVLDEEARPVPAASVACSVLSGDRSKSESALQAVHSGSTDAAGEWSGLFASGSMIVEARLGQLATRFMTFVEPAPRSDEQLVTLVLRPCCSLALETVGQVPEGVELHAVLIQRDQSLIRVVGDAVAGKFHWKDLTAGKYSIEVARPAGWAVRAAIQGPRKITPFGAIAVEPWDFQVHVAVGEAAVHQIRLIRACSLIGRVLREDGGAVRQVAVECRIAPRSSRDKASFRVSADPRDVASPFDIEGCRTSWTAETGANGEFRFDGLPPADFVVAVRDVALAAPPKRVSVVPGEPTSVELLAGDGAMLLGAAPVPGYLFVENVRTRTVVTAYVDGSSFRLPGLVPGPCDVFFRLTDDLSRAGAPLFYRRLELEAGAATFLAIDADMRATHGRVTYQGRPAAGAVVRAAPFRARADAAGDFVLHTILLPTSVNVEWRGLVHQGLSFAGAAGGVVDLVLPSRPVVITGDGDAEGAVLVLQGPGFLDSVGAVVRSGRASFDGVPNEQCRLLVRFLDGALQESVVPADVTEFFVSRRPTGTLVVACEGADGMPLPDAHVVVSQPGVAGQGGKRKAQTGADGSVSLPGLLEGKAVVTVADRGRSREGTVQVVPGTTVALTLRLP